MIDTVSGQIKNFISSTGIDTLALSKYLQKNGFTIEQSEALSSTIKESSEAMHHGQNNNVDEKIEQAEDRTNATFQLLRKEIQTMEEKLDLKIDSKIDMVRMEVKAVDEKLTAKINLVESNLKEEISKNKTETIKWMVGLLLAQMGIILAVVNH